MEPFPSIRFDRNETNTSGKPQTQQNSMISPAGMRALEPDVGRQVVGDNRMETFEEEGQLDEPSEEIARNRFRPLPSSPPVSHTSRFVVPAFDGPLDVVVSGPFSEVPGIQSMLAGFDEGSCSKKMRADELPNIEEGIKTNESQKSAPNRSSLSAWSVDTKRSSISSYYSALSFAWSYRSSWMPPSRRSSAATFQSAKTNDSSAEKTSRKPRSVSTWLSYLKGKDLIPAPFDELDWSGGGQHAEYTIDEEHDIPLQADRVLGFTGKALVERVRCRRIILARKTIRCSRRISREEAMQEVEQLQRLQHSHLVRLVGSYVIGRNLCILMYPAAEYNLENFLDSAHDALTCSAQSVKQKIETTKKLSALTTFFGCLASAVQYIHSRITKHMDIKPKNIIVKSRKGIYKVYITDFEIARTYASVLESDTETPVPCSRHYAAPEVVLQTVRGFKADIFSLGCVFAEMITTLYSTPEADYRQQLRDILCFDASYQANIEDVQNYIEDLSMSPKQDIDVFVYSQHLVLNPEVYSDLFTSTKLSGSRLLAVINLMLNENPGLRPIAEELSSFFIEARLSCGRCDKGPEPFEIAQSSDAS